MSLKIEVIQCQICGAKITGKLTAKTAIPINKK